VVNFGFLWQLAEELVALWQTYPDDDHIPVHKQLLDIAIKSIVLTSFGDFFSDDNEVQLLRQNYNIVWTCVTASSTKSL
jgi:hypothetical protein